MSLRSATAVRTSIVVVALSVGAICALGAMEARAEATASETGSQAACAEGRARLAAKLAYLEARISPDTGQQAAWRTFVEAVQGSASELDRVCAEAPLFSESADAADRLERMERHAAAAQAMFGAMAKAYRAVAPVLTAAQRDILSQNIVPSPPTPGLLPWPPVRLGPRPRFETMTQSCGASMPEFPDLPAPGRLPPF